MAILQVDSLIKVSRKFCGNREFSKAIEVNSIAEKLALNKFGKWSAEYGSCCHNLGRILSFKGDNLESEKCYFEALAIRENVFGKMHSVYAVSLNGLAVLYFQTGNYEKAEILFTEAKTIREKVLGKEHPDYLSSLNNLGVLYVDLGYYEKAEPLIIEAKNIREKVLGKEHLDFAVSLSSLAELYSFLGQYEKAESLFIQAKNIREVTLGKEHPTYSQSLNNLAIVYYSMGIFYKAEALYLEAKIICEKVFGKEHPEYATSLNNLAILYNDIGNFEKSESLYIEAIAIRETKLGKEHPAYATSICNLANLYTIIGKYEKAELLYLESKAIREKVFGKENFDYASSLNNLANIYSQICNYEKAAPLFIEAKQIYEKVLGIEHPHYTQLLNAQAIMYEYQKQFVASNDLLSRASDLEQLQLLRATTFLSENELASYTKSFQKRNDELGALILSRSLIDHNEGLSDLAYNNSLFYKGFLLTASKKLNVLSNSDVESREIYIKLKIVYRKLAAEYSKPIANRNGVEELLVQADIAEKELAHSISGYSDVIKKVNWQNVQSTLKMNEAAIEFIHFRVNFPKLTDSIMYAALLILPGSEQVKFIQLFEKKLFDSLFQSDSETTSGYINMVYNLTNRNVDSFKTTKKSIYELIWKPLENHLLGINTIYYSPTGLLHKINMAAIPITSTKNLSDKYRLITLNSTRQLVIPNKILFPNNDAILYGGINFEQDTNLLKSETISNDFATASHSATELSFNSIDTTLRGGTWGYLLGTEKEVNTMEKIMQLAKIPVRVVKGFAGTEESIKSISNNKKASPRILHIATHGYFFPDPKVVTSTGIVKEHETNVFKTSDHPMMRSGLIMSGGNAAWTGNYTLVHKDDGILTAYEISQMDLSNTELVVLSACETGLGDIQGNEGVYGLQRAFKIAGVKYLIMSLWQVPDKQTSLLMTTFYKKWLIDKLTIPEAFQGAQMELRELGFEPFQWAGFILVE